MQHYGYLLVFFESQFGIITDGIQKQHLLCFEYIYIMHRVNFSSACDRDIHRETFFITLYYLKPILLAVYKCCRLKIIIFNDTCYHSVECVLHAFDKSTHIEYAKHIFIIIIGASIRFRMEPLSLPVRALHRQFFVYSPSAW